MIRIRAEDRQDAIDNCVEAARVKEAAEQREEDLKTASVRHKQQMQALCAIGDQARESAEDTQAVIVGAVAGGAVLSRLWNRKFY